MADIDLKPTEQMASNAARGLELRERHGKGGTAVGVARARDIKNRANLSPSTVRRMHSFFSRHAGNERGGEDDAGYIAFMLWGGAAGRDWAARKSAQLDKSESARFAEGYKGFVDPWAMMSPEDRRMAGKLQIAALRAMPSSPRQRQIRAQLMAILAKYGLDKQPEDRMARFAATKVDLEYVRGVGQSYGTRAGRRGINRLIDDREALARVKLLTYGTDAMSPVRAKIEKAFDEGWLRGMTKAKIAQVEHPPKFRIGDSVSYSIGTSTHIGKVVHVLAYTEPEPQYLVEFTTLPTGRPRLNIDESSLQKSAHCRSLFSHDIRLPKGKRRLNIDEATAALNQMGYKLGGVRYDPHSNGSVYKLTQPNGSVVDIPAADLTAFIYEKARHMKNGSKAAFGTNKRVIRYAGHEFLAEDEGNRTRISIKVDGAWEHVTTVNTDNQTATEWIEANAKPSHPSQWLPGAFSRSGVKARFGATHAEVHRTAKTWLAKVNRTQPPEGLEQFHARLKARLAQIVQDTGEMLRNPQMIEDYGGWSDADLKDEILKVAGGSNVAYRWLATYLGSGIYGFARPGTKTAFSIDAVKAAAAKVAAAYGSGNDAAVIRRHLDRIVSVLSGNSEGGRREAIGIHAQIGSIAERRHGRDFMWSAPMQGLENAIRSAGQFARHGARSRFDRMAVANEILRQLGGGRFMAMVGGKNALATTVNGKPGLQVSIGRGAKDGINRLIVLLDEGRDTYDMQLWRIGQRGLSTTKVWEGSDLYAEDLARIFTDKTGFYTSFRRTGAKAAFNMTGNELYDRVVPIIIDMNQFVTLSAPRVKASIDEAVKYAKKTEAFGEKIMRDKVAGPELLRELDRMASVVRAQHGWRISNRGTYSRPGARLRFALIPLSKMREIKKDYERYLSWVKRDPDAQDHGKPKSFDQFVDWWMDQDQYIDPNELRGFADPMHYRRPGARAAFSDASAMASFLRFLDYAGTAVAKKNLSLAQDFYGQATKMIIAHPDLNRAGSNTRERWLDIGERIAKARGFGRMGAKASFANWETNLTRKHGHPIEEHTAKIGNNSWKIEVAESQSDGSIGANLFLWNDLRGFEHFKSGSLQELRNLAERTSRSDATGISKINRIANYARPGAKSTHAGSDAVSRKVATLVREGYKRDQAVAIAYDMKRRGEL